jgi:hypothetical protein
MCEGDMILCLKDPKDSTRRLLVLIHYDAHFQQNSRIQNHHTKNSSFSIQQIMNSLQKKSAKQSHYNSFKKVPRHKPNQRR